MASKTNKLKEGTAFGKNRKLFVIIILFADGIA